MPTILEATYRVVTPLFCAGADSAQPELRLPSFKGVLRFWWRALAWPRCGGDLADIQQQENHLFGSADGGQSRVLMRLAPSDSAPKICEKNSVLTVTAGQKQAVGTGARYLGYGVMVAFGKHAGQLTRACLRAPFSFTVQLRCRDLSATQLEQLRDALIALGTIGGMGAKSRKGYGSLALQSLSMDDKPCWNAPESMDDLEAAIRHLRYEQEKDGLPEYTAFSSGTRHILLSGGNIHPLQLLDQVGREMVRYRSWGHGGKILENIESEKNFKDDHDLMKGGKPTKHPRRIAFGLPHNYGKKQVVPHEKTFDRRASPLFIQIHQCDGTAVAVLSFLPARFLPEGKSRISVAGNQVGMKPEKELYRPIHEFLNRLLNKNQRKESFSGAIKIRP